MNALAGLMNPAAIGQQVQGAFEQGQQKRLQQDSRNALTAYAANPNEETLLANAPYNPQLVMQERQRMATQQQQQAKQKRADMPMMVKLLETATDPQTWQRNMQVAQQYGIDTSSMPQQFDPEWRSENLMSLKALSTPEGQEVMSTAGKQAYDEGLRPGDGKFEARAKEIFQQSGAIPYTGLGGETLLYVPGQGEPTNQRIAEGTVVANDAGEQMVLRNGKWEAMKGGRGAGVTATFLD